MHDFLAFMRLYHEVVGSPHLTLAEKTAAIETAFDEYIARLQPPAFRRIAERLSKEPPKEPHAESREEAPPPPAKAQAGRPNGVGARSGRRN